MSALQDALSNCVLADQAAVTLCTARLDAARVERGKAALALAEAQARLAAMSAEERRLEDQQRTLNATLSMSRAALMQTITTNMPDDILRCIFEEMSLAPDEEWEIFGAGAYNEERALIPFDLAAVCTKWRRVCCDTPSLWTYIGVPELLLAADADAHGVRVDLSLSRSKACGLEVFLGWNAGKFTLADGDKNDDATSCAAGMRRIFLALAQHAGRWKRVEIWLPDMPNNDLMRPFRGPTPRLEQLCIVCHVPTAPGAQNPEELYFPHAPRLYELELCATGMFPFRRHSGFGALRSIRLWRETSGAHAQELLKLAHMTLETVLIDLTCQWVDALPIAFPKLKSLTVFNKLFMSPPLFTAPHLFSLTLHPRAIKPAASASLNALSSTVTHLVITGGVKAAKLDVLRTLDKVTHFTVTKTMLDEPCHIDDGFFSHLAVTEPVVWPALKSIVIRTGGNVIPPDGHGIIQLLAARNIVPEISSSAAADELPCKLDEVVLDYEGVPLWLREEANRLLSL